MDDPKPAPELLSPHAPRRTRANAPGNRPDRAVQEHLQRSRSCKTAPSFPLHAVKELATALNAANLVYLPVADISATSPPSPSSFAKASED